MIAQRRLEMDSHHERGAVSVRSIAGLAILAVVAYAAYTFVAGSGVLL